MKNILIITLILLFSCKTYKKSVLLSRTNKGDYEIQVWDVKKFSRKNDSLICHNIDTIIRIKTDNSNGIMTDSKNTAILNPTK